MANQSTYNLDQLVRVTLRKEATTPMFSLVYKTASDKWYCKRKEGYLFTDWLNLHLYGREPLSKLEIEGKFDCTVKVDESDGVAKAYRKASVEMVYSNDEDFTQYFDTDDDAVRFYNDIKRRVPNPLTTNN